MHKRGATARRQRFSRKNPSVFSSDIGANIRCSGDFIDLHGSGITALATLVIAAFTGTLWRATSLQASLTKEALIADKRAFIFADSLFSLWEQGDNPDSYNWRFRPVWRNSGDTPTKNLEIHSYCSLRNTALPDNFDFSRADKHQIGGGLLGPKSSLNGGLAPQSPNAAITPQDIIDVQAGRKFLYLWGYARYNDVFPGTPRHITRFCWAIFVVGDPTAFIPGTSAPAYGSKVFSNVYLPQGNCADEECKN